MILADTSAWVEFDRRTGSVVHRRIATLIRENGPLATTEPVLMEVLAGARTDERDDALRRLLLRFQLLPLEIAVDFDGAARIYRRCRQRGITPRGLIDCMIISVAQRHRATLLAQDRDIERVASVVGVALDLAS